MQLTNTLIGVARSNLEITANLIIIMADCVRMGDDVAALDYFKQVRDVLPADVDKLSEAGGETGGKVISTGMKQIEPPKIAATTT